MDTTKLLELKVAGPKDRARISEVTSNFVILDELAESWNGFSNTGTVKAEGTDFAITPVLKIATDLFSLTVKMPRTFAEDDTITVDGVAYTLYQGSDPADSEAWKAGEVVTLNFDKSARRCWAGGGGGVPKPLPAQISNLKGIAVEGETPKIDWTWTNPVDENFSGMVLVVKEGSSPNGPTDGVQVYKGSSTTVTQSEGLQFERTYYARGFAYNSQGKYQMNAEGATATVELSAVPEQVSDVVMTPNKSHATLTWTNPVSTNLQTIKVIQKIGSDPENPNDGTQVYEGTGTTVTVDNLQDSIDYRFGIFAIGKNGKYKDPVVKNYTPAFLPRYSYTGDHQLIKDENDHWRTKLTSSGVFENTGDEDLVVDLFMVGGGGGANVGGGGSGYTKTVKKITLRRGDRISVEIGAGGHGVSYTGTTNAAGDGGTTKFSTYEVAGGKGALGHIGGNGGSGGGAGSNSYSSGVVSGSAGCDGGDGGAISTSPNPAGGKGQGTTTREFGEPGNPLHAGGGVGAYVQGGSPGVACADGSGPNGDYGKTGTYSGPFTFVGCAGGCGYGGGGGGGFPGGNGSAGVVIIRDAREDA